MFDRLTRRGLLGRLLAGLLALEKTKGTFIFSGGGKELFRSSGVSNV